MQPGRVFMQRIAWLVILPGVQTACTGNITSEGAPGPGAGAQDVAGTGRAGTAGVTGASTGPTGPTDPGFVSIQRLNNTEYANTVRDLLGVSATPANTFIADEKALGFDVIASAKGMTAAQYEQYFNAAESLAAAAFADPRLAARIVTCTPPNPQDGRCLEQIVRAFGLRAWRRPLEDAEVARLVRLAGEARALGEDLAGTVRHVVASVLAAVPFLYRIERDPGGATPQPHALDGHALASRLSYFLWSTTPDERLLQLAAGGQLVSDATLAAQLERMFEDPRSAAFVNGFAGQWLGLRELHSHQVEPGAFPDWDEPLRRALIAEGTLYFRELLAPARTVSDFFTLPVNFVDARLARHYRLTPRATDQPTRIENATPDRTGFLGLGAFLTTTSFSHRTSPTLRGVWILGNLLCSPPPDPPADVPELDAPGVPPADNVRVRLAQHRVNPACAGCHTLFDALGLGLEGFDAIGRSRTRYPNGDAVDTSGTLPDGTSFRGQRDLAAVLARDQRFAACVSEKLFVYAHGRATTAADVPAFEALRASWRAEGQGLRALLRHMVMGRAFRWRRAEGPV